MRSYIYEGMINWNRKHLEVRIFKFKFIYLFLDLAISWGRTWNKYNVEEKSLESKSEILLYY